MKKIRSYLVKNIPAQIYKQLYSLNYREAGCMRDCLVEARQSDTNDDFIIAYMDDDKVLGWCLVHNAFYSDEKVLQIYVRQALRGHGIGTKVIKKAKQKLQKMFKKMPKVYYDNANTFFYANGFRRKV